MMGYIADLKAEVESDPVSIGYAIPGGTPTADEIHKDPTQQAANQAIADLLNSNSTNREESVTTLSKQQVLDAMYPDEVGAVTAANAAKVGWILQLDLINPFASAVVQVFKEAFGVNSETLTNLNTLRTRTITRAQELGFQKVKPGHVAMARCK